MIEQFSSKSLSHYAFPHPGPSADVSFVKRKILDVPYAFLSPAQKLDIYLPDEGKKPYSVIVSIHSEAFMVAMMAIGKHCPCGESRMKYAVKMQD